MDAWKALRAVRNFDCNLSSRYVVKGIVLWGDTHNTQYCAEMRYTYMSKKWFTLDIDTNGIVVKRGGSVIGKFPVQRLDFEWRCERLREEKRGRGVVVSTWEHFATDKNTGEEQMIHESETIVHLYYSDDREGGATGSQGVCRE